MFYITAKIMNVTETFKEIYNGPFVQYLQVSEKIGGPVEEQSKLVDILFLLEINLVEVVQKYKKPIHEQEENIFFEPIDVQIENIRKFRIENDSPPYACHLSLVSESMEIFEWIKQTDIGETLRGFENSITPYVDNIRRDLLKLDMIHADWLYMWTQFLEDFNLFLLNFYKNGLIWVGNETLPQQILQGDISAIYKDAYHLKLLKEINQGENITSILRQTIDNTDQLDTDD